MGHGRRTGRTRVAQLMAISPTQVSRRGLLASPVALMVDQRNGWQATLRARSAALGDAGLLQSYEVAGSAAFDLTHAGCAYVYDNAVAGLALLASGDTEGAGRIATALALAQAQDRFWHDGRLRNAYRAGPAPPHGTYPLAGWWDAPAATWREDAYQVGTATGVVAWAMLLWTRLGGDYLRAARRAADWVEGAVRMRQGYAGGFLGFEPAPQRLTWISTEHNLDLAVAFAALGRREAASHAADFVASMWLPDERRFATGLRPDGSLNHHSAVDANLWPLLASDARPDWRAALAWVLSHHGLPPGMAPEAAVDGVDFDTDRDGIWLEGTAITALAARRLGLVAVASRLLETLRRQTSPGGLVYATTTPSLTTGLSTGLDTHAPDFLYFRRPQVAPTAWAVLAALGASPFIR